jgi:hypothetical protein
MAAPISRRLATIWRFSHLGFLVRRRTMSPPGPSEKVQM